MNHILKRIEKEAIQFKDRHPYDAIHSAYYMGAKSERNKVVDEVRNVYTDTLPSGDCQAWDFVKAAQEFLKRIESLKVDL